MSQKRPKTKNKKGGGFQIYKFMRIRECRRVTKRKSVIQDLLQYVRGSPQFRLKSTIYPFVKRKLPMYKKYEVQFNLTLKV